VVSVAVIIAVAVNTDGVREILGVATGPSEAEPFWTDFLRGLTRRGLRGVKLVISDSHEGLKAAASKVLKTTWQRCRVHFIGNASAHAGKGQRQAVLAMINTIFVQESSEAASGQWRTVADQLRPKFPKLAAMMDDAEHDVLAFMDFPRAHRLQIHSTNPLERLNAEVKRRTNVIGIFPNDQAIIRLVGAMMLEQNDEWSAPATSSNMATTVKCGGCHSKVTPRLWHYRSSIPFRYMKTQHLCPICGRCLSVTGGEMHWSGHVWLTVMFLVTASLANAFKFHENWFQWTFVGYIAYVLWRIARASYNLLGWLIAKLKGSR